MEVETFFRSCESLLSIKMLTIWALRTKTMGLMKHYWSANIIPSKQPVNNAVVVVVVVVVFHLLSNFVERITWHRFHFSFHSEYIKVIDGNGITVLSHNRYSSVTQKTLREVSFGNSGNITVQIYLRRSYSNFKLQFGILKRGSG